MRSIPGITLVIIAGFLIAGGSVLAWAGCATQDVPVTDAGAPLVDFQPRAQVDGRWVGDIIIAEQVAARDLTYAGSAADIEGTDEILRVAWVPGTMTVEAAAGTPRGQWYFVLAVVLILAGAVLEEYARRRMRTHGAAA
ncbi:MAG: hypothetical protein FJW92_03565 [Actinobacteria bacterium]|nr:hypothetical protein [Actinomycetota bacterium]